VINADWVRAELTRTLGLLAAPADQQLAYLKMLGGSNDELGLEFDDVAAGAAGLPSTSQDLAIAIGAINDQLRSMSGPANARLWQDEAIRSDDHWQRLRHLAKEALELLRRDYGPQTQ
jgi:hypothetical protein